jgi:hypothetical protein
VVGRLVMRTRDQLRREMAMLLARQGRIVVDWGSLMVLWSPSSLSWSSLPSLAVSNLVEPVSSSLEHD